MRATAVEALEMNPVPWQDLVDWLDEQWGPGRQYLNKSDLAYAIGSKASLGYIKDKGVTTFTTARAVADATGVSVLFVLVKAGVITQADLREFSHDPLSPEQVEWLVQLEVIQDAMPDLYEGLREACQGAYNRIQRRRQ